MWTIQIFRNDLVTTQRGVIALIEGKTDLGVLGWMVSWGTPKGSDYPGFYGEVMAGTLRQRDLPRGLRPMSLEFLAILCHNARWAKAWENRPPESIDEDRILTPIPDCRGSDLCLPMEAWTVFCEKYPETVAMLCRPPALNAPVMEQVEFALNQVLMVRANLNRALYEQSVLYREIQKAIRDLQRFSREEKEGQATRLLEELQSRLERASEAWQELRHTQLSALNARGEALRKLETQMDRLTEQEKMMALLVTPDVSVAGTLARHTPDDLARGVGDARIELQARLRVLLDSSWMT